MALRFLARRVGFPAAFRHRILPPYPSAGGSRSLTTKGDDSDKVKFLYQHYKGSKVTGKEIGEQIAKCLVREDFKISVEGARELIFVKFGPIGKDVKVSEEDMHARIPAILKAASNGGDTTRAATGDWIQYTISIIIAIAFTEAVLPSKQKKDMEQIKMEIERLQKENSTFRGIEHVVRALAVQRGLEYDALVQKTEMGGPRDGAEVERSLGEDKAEIDEETAAKMRAALEKFSKEVQKIAKGPSKGP